MLFAIFLFGLLIVGLLLMVSGLILLLKVKNKIIGIVIMGAGLIFTLIPTLIYLYLVPITSIRG